MCLSTAASDFSHKQVIWILQSEAQLEPSQNSSENRYILISNPNAKGLRRPMVRIKLVPPARDGSGPYDRDLFSPYEGIRGGGSPATTGPPHHLTARVTPDAATAFVTHCTSLALKNNEVKKKFVQLPDDLGALWRLGCIIGPSGSGKSVAVSRLPNLSTLPEAVWGDRVIINVLGDDVQCASRRAAAVGLSSEEWNRPLLQLSSGKQAAARMAYALTPFDVDTGVACTVAIDEAFSFHDPDTAVACAHTLRAFLGQRNAPTKLVLAGAAINRALLAVLQPDWIFNPSQPATQSLHIFTDPVDQTGDIVPRPPTVPPAAELFSRYTFTGTVRKCLHQVAQTNRHWDMFKRCAPRCLSSSRADRPLCSFPPQPPLH
jgi:hypothetical protein